MRWKNAHGPLCYLAGLLTLTVPQSSGQSLEDVSRQIAGLMSQNAGGKTHARYVHTKGIVCEGTFRASPGAGSIS